MNFALIHVYLRYSVIDNYCGLVKLIYKKKKKNRQLLWSGKANLFLKNRQLLWYGKANI